MSHMWKTYNSQFKGMTLASPASVCDRRAVATLGPGWHGTGRHSRFDRSPDVEEKEVAFA